MLVAGHNRCCYGLEFVISSVIGGVGLDRLAKWKKVAISNTNFLMHRSHVMNNTAEKNDRKEPGKDLVFSFEKKKLSAQFQSQK